MWLDAKAEMAKEMHRCPSPGPVEKAMDALSTVLSSELLQMDDVRSRLTHS